MLKQVRIYFLNRYVFIIIIIIDYKILFDLTVSQLYHTSSRRDLFIYFKGSFIKYFFFFFW